MSNSKLIKSLELSRSLMRSQIEALREEAEDYKLLDRVERTESSGD